MLPSGFEYDRSQPCGSRSSSFNSRCSGTLDFRCYAAACAQAKRTAWTSSGVGWSGCDPRRDVYRGARPGNNHNAGAPLIGMSTSVRPADCADRKRGHSDLRGDASHTPAAPGVPSRLGEGHHPGRRPPADAARRRCRQDRAARRQPGGLPGAQVGAFEHRIAAAVADPGVVDISTPMTGQVPHFLAKMIEAGEGTWRAHCAIWARRGDLGQVDGGLRPGRGGSAAVPDRVERAGPRPAGRRAGRGEDRRQAGGGVAGGKGTAADLRGLADPRIGPRWRRAASILSVACSRM